MLTIVEDAVESKAATHLPLAAPNSDTAAPQSFNELNPSRTPQAKNASRCSVLLTVSSSLLSNCLWGLQVSMIEVSGRSHSQMTEGRKECPVSCQALSKLGVSLSLAYYHGTYRVVQNATRPGAKTTQVYAHIALTTTGNQVDTPPTVKPWMTNMKPRHDIAM